MPLPLSRLPWDIAQDEIRRFLLIRHQGALLAGQRKDEFWFITWFFPLRQNLQRHAISLSGIQIPGPGGPACDSNGIKVHVDRGGVTGVGELRFASEIDPRDFLHAAERVWTEAVDLMLMPQSSDGQVLSKAVQAFDLRLPEPAWDEKP